jgi:hypothetical protein
MWKLMPTAIALPMVLTSAILSIISKASGRQYRIVPTARQAGEEFISGRIASCR